MKRAEKLCEALSGSLQRERIQAFMEKHRNEGVVSGGTPVGNVEGKVVLVVDDLISSGTTMIRAAEASWESGAKKVYAIATTHGLFTGGAAEVLADERLDSVWITGSIPPFCLPQQLLEEKVKVVFCAPLIAEAVKRIHTADSLVDLLAL